MNARFKIMIMSFFTVGMIIWFVSQIIRPDMTDFISGFLSGLSIVFILTGIAYMGWCVGKKKNPFKFK